MVRVLNFNSLRSLTLRMCPGTGEFLKRVLQMLSHLPDYLDVFEGLKELCLGKTEACDLPDMGISTFEISKILKEPALNPFSKLDLEFLGLSCVPELLFVFRDKFHDFLKWVFGPDGIRSLHMIVFGDFAYGGRIAQKNVLLCRDFGGNKGFRVINAVDAEWIEPNVAFTTSLATALGVKAICTI
ncbi:hypothetical protein O9K51_09720 [Purpureocillium lavendulum]|uniref:Uncharacterized protein n=1 Tax=Purpureocillium lavendulum TaxID=1247861 RepID=A0AB34FG05_9HYPO|nr:hypothetical protein O9K51_09720 [Purpureocillium lavendulum]